MRILTLILLLTSVGVGRAQIDPGVEQNFRQQCVGKKLFLKDFSAASALTYQWTAAGLTSQVVLFKTFGVVNISAIKVKKDRIEMTGLHATMLRGKNNQYALTPGMPLDIVVELGSADPNVVLPQLKEALFYERPEEALAHVPDLYQKMLPINVDPNGKSHADDPIEAHPCMTGKLKPPKILHLVDPEFSQKAKDDKFSGGVFILLTIEESGAVRDLWLASRPLGHGLDEEAAKSIAVSTFKPATCNGLPEAVGLRVGINFNIF